MEGQSVDASISLINQNKIITEGTGVEGEGQEYRKETRKEGTGSGIGRQERSPEDQNNE